MSPFASSHQRIKFITHNPRGTLPSGEGPFESNTDPMDTTTRRVFYIGPTASNPHPTLVDVAVQAEGKITHGLQTQQTAAQLSALYGTEVLEGDWPAVARLIDESYVTQPEPITEQAYVAAFEAIPPVRWGSWNGVESFMLSEIYTGQIAYFYAKAKDGTYWRFRDFQNTLGIEIAAKINAASQLIHETKH